MSHIRMKHSDKDARASFLEGEPDEGGGFMVKLEHVEAAQSHGWMIDVPETGAIVSETTDDGAAAGTAASPPAETQASLEAGQQSAAAPAEEPPKAAAPAPRRRPSGG